MNELAQLSGYRSKWLLIPLPLLLGVPRRRGLTMFLRGLDEVTGRAQLLLSHS